MTIMKTEVMKKQLLLSILLLFPMLAIADDSGTCGNGVTYFFEEATGTLTISKTGEGNGEMTSIPWDTYHSSITKVVIEAGVTSIGSSAFEYC